MSGRPTVLIDLDDTLIECGIYYRDAREAGARLIAERTGMQAEAADKLISHLDLVALQHNPCFSKARFPRSFAAAMAAACQLHEVAASEWEENRLEALAVGMSVFDAPYALKPDAIHLLVELRSLGYQLVLVTKGSIEVQLSKIARHGLTDLVDAVEVVKTKSSASWANVYATHRVDPTRSYAIGDSLKDDIAPNQAAGSATILVQSELTWSFNDHEVTPDAEVETLRDVLLYVPPIPSGVPYLVHG